MQAHAFARRAAAGPWFPWTPGRDAHAHVTERARTRGDAGAHAAARMRAVMPAQPFDPPRTPPRSAKTAGEAR